MLAAAAITVTLVTRIIIIIRLESLQVAARLEASALVMHRQRRLVLFRRAQRALVLDGNTGAVVLIHRARRRQGVGL